MASYVITANNQHGQLISEAVTASQGEADSGVVVTADSRVTQYEIQETLSGIGPDEALMKRDGQDLLLFLEEGDEQPHIIIDHYYDEPPADVAGRAADGNSYLYQSGQGDEVLMAAALSDGEWLQQTLNAPHQSDNGSDGGSSLLESSYLPLGLASLGGGAYVLSQGGGGGSSSSDPDSQDLSAPSLAMANSSESDDGVATTNDGTVMVSDLEDGDGWEYSTDGGNTWQAGQGESFDLDEGEYQDGDVQARQVDDSGSPGDVGLMGPIVVDTTPPDAPSITSANADGLSGTAEPDSVVTLKDANGQSLIEVNADNDGHWDISPGDFPGGDPDGFEGEATATDEVGNESEATPIGPIDGDAPEPADIDSANGDGISGTAEPDNTIVLKDGNGQTVTETEADDSGDWSIPSEDFPNGDPDGFEGEVLVRDEAGNTSDSTAIEPIDGSAPPAPTLELENDSGTDDSDGITSDGTVRVHDLEEGASWEYSTDAGDSWQEGVGESFVLSEGEYSEGDVLARQIDESGNQGDSGELGEVVVDATPPAEPVIERANADELAGTAEPDSLVTLIDDEGTLVAEVTANESGEWQIGAEAFPGGETDGFEGEVTATDRAGNESSPALVGPIDGEAPPAPSVETANGEGISGTSEPDYTITLRDSDGNTVTEVVADSSGDWDVSASAFPDDNPDGFEGEITTTDQAGNESESVSIGPIDGEPPETPEVSTANADGLEGTAEPGSQITLNDSEGQEVTSVEADESGNWSIPAEDFPDQDPDGFEGSVTATDEAGNLSSTTEIESIDGQPPMAPTLALENDTGADDGDGITSDGTVLVQDLEDGATWEYTTDGGDTWEPGTGDSFVLAEGEYGEEDVQGRQTDEAGNVSDAGQLGEVVVDTTAPEAPIVEDANADGLSGTAEGESTITLKDSDDNAVATADTDAGGQWSIPASEFPGEDPDGFEGEVTATDEAGNESDAASVGPIDGEAPDEPVVETANADGLSGTAEPDSTITLQDTQGDTVATTEADGSGNWSIPASEFPGEDPDGFDGEVTATDEADNESDATSVGPIDGEEPDEPVVETANADGLSGTAEPDSTITLRDAQDATVATTEADGSGNWSIPAEDFPGEDPDGFDGSVTATDEAGNESSTTQIESIDGQLPAAPTLALENDTGSDDSDGITSDGTVLVQDLEDGATWEYTTDGGDTWEPGTGDSFVLAEGEYGEEDVKARQIDDAGNVSDSGELGEVVVDTTAPEAPVVEDANADELAGTAEPGSLVTLMDDQGQVVEEVTTDESGEWRFAAEVFPGGETDDFEGEVTATDEAGNTSESSPVGPIDGSVPSPPSIETANADGLAGTANEDYTITLFDNDGQVVSQVGVDAAGQWEIPATDFPGEDPDGFEGEIIATNSEDVDSEAKAVGPIDGQAPDEPVVETANADGLSGTAEPGSTITLRDAQDDTVATTEADGSGNWSIPAEDFPDQDPDGFEGSVTATDEAGNVSSSTDIESIDGQPPVAPTLALENDTGSDDSDGITSDGTVLVQDLEDGATWEYTTDGGDTWEPGTGDSFVLAEGEYGEEDVQARQTDEAGNVSDAGQLGEVVVDTTAPEAPIVEDANANGLSGTAEGESTITLKDSDGNAVATADTDAGGQWSIPASEFPGEDPDDFEGEVTATDEAGNESDATSVGPIDGDVPTGPLVETANAEGLSGTAEPDSTITLNDSLGNTVTTTEADGSGNWSIPAADFPDQDPDGFEGDVTATDDAGNESDATSVGPIDGEAPDEPVVEAANADGLSGTAEPDSTITLKDSLGDTVTTTEADGSGNWSIPPEDFPGEDPDGFEGTVTATDEAGNLSSSTDIESIDGQPPAAPTLALENDTGANDSDGITSDGTVLVQDLEDGATWEYTTDGGATWQVGSGDRFELEDGDYSEEDVQARQTDEAGNVSDAGQLGEVVVDSTPPEGDVSVESLQTADTTPTVSGTFTERDEHSYLEVTVDGVTYVEGEHANLVVDVESSVDGKESGTWTLAIDEDAARAIENDSEISGLNAGGSTHRSYDVTAQLMSLAGSASETPASGDLDVFAITVTPLPDETYVADTQPTLTGLGNVLDPDEDLIVEVLDADGILVKRFSADDGEVIIDETQNTWQVNPESWGDVHLDDGNYSIRAFAEVPDGEGAQSAPIERDFQVITPALSEIENPDGFDDNVPSAFYDPASAGYLMVYARGVAGDEWHLYGQRVDATGQALTNQFLLANNDEDTGHNNDRRGHLRLYDVEMRDDGSFVVAYTYNSNRDTSISLFNADLEPVRQSEVTLTDTNRSGTPQLAFMDDGGYVLLNTSGSTSDYGIQMRRYDADNEEIPSSDTPVSGEAGDFFITFEDSQANGLGYRIMDSDRGWGQPEGWSDISSSGTEGRQAVMGLSAENLGTFEYEGELQQHFALLYMSSQEGGSAGSNAGVDGDMNTNIYLRIMDFDSGWDAQAFQDLGYVFESDSDVVAPENLYRVNQETQFYQMGTETASLKEGGFVTIWASNHTSPDGTGAEGAAGRMQDFNVYGRRLDWDGTNVIEIDDRERQINGSEDGVNGMAFDREIAFLDVAGLQHGGYVVTWTKSYLDDSGRQTGDVYMQMYDAAGNAVGGESLVSSMTGDNWDYNSNVEALGDGGFVVSWVSDDARYESIGYHNGDNVLDADGSRTNVHLILNADGTVRGDGDVGSYGFDAHASYVNEADASGLLAGGDGVDTLDGREGGALDFDAGAGNDLIILYDDEFNSIDGGDGFDTLIWGGDDALLDFSEFSDRIDNIEALRLGDESSVNITLGIQDVLNMTSADDNNLVIQGSDNDSVDLDDWTASGSQHWRGDDYQVYSYTGATEDEDATLWVQQTVSVI